MKNHLRSTVKISIVLLLCFVISGKVFAQIPSTGGNYTIDNTLGNTFAGGATGNFSSFLNAITALNATAAGTIASNVTFTVTAGETFTEPALPLKITYTNNNAALPLITFVKSAGTDPILSSSTSGSGSTTPTLTFNIVTLGFDMLSGDAFIEFVGSENITFNGIDLTEAYTGSTSTLEMEMGYLLIRASATVGCQGVTIENSTINLNKAQASISVGIYQANTNGTAILAPTAVSGCHVGNKFYNNTIKNAAHGIVLNGSSTAGIPLYDENNQIGGATAGTGNTITLFGGTGGGNDVFGIVANCQSGLTIANNVIDSGVNATTGIGTFIAGMYLMSMTTTNIYNNKIYAITCTTGGSCSNCTYVYGLYCSDRTASTGPVYIYNNYIGDLSAPPVNWSGIEALVGVFLSSGASDYIGFYYNTVYLNTSPTNPSTSSQSTWGLYTVGTTNTLDIRNNIVINTSTPGGSASAPGYTVAHESQATTFTNYTTSNNNLFYAGTPGPYNLIYSGGGTVPGSASAQTICQYQAITSPAESFSVSESPVWLNSTNGANANYLHINGATAQLSYGGAAPITSPISITTDYNGTTRSATLPDIGADEYVGTAGTAMSVSSSTTSAVTGTSLVGSTSQAVLEIAVTTSGTYNPVTINSFLLNALGTTNIADIANAKIWYNGSSTTFNAATATLFGTLASPTYANFTISGSQKLAAPCSGSANYFFLTYDVVSGSACDNLEGECASITYNTTSTSIPTVLTTGGRQVQASCLSGIYTIDNSIPGSCTNYTSFTAALSDLNSLGVCGKVKYLVKAGETFNETHLVITATGTSTNTIAFVKNGVGKNPKIEAPYGSGTQNPSSSSATPGDAMLTLDGASYITFNGINLVDTGAQNESLAGNTDAFRMETGVVITNSSVTIGAWHDTIENCKILMDSLLGSTEGNGNYDQAANFGVLLYPAFTPSAHSGTNSYNQIINDTIPNSASAIYFTGTTSNSASIHDVGNCAIGNYIKRFGSNYGYNGLSTFIYTEAGITLWYSEDSSIIANNYIGANRIASANSIYDITAWCQNSVNSCTSISIYGNTLLNLNWTAAIGVAGAPIGFFNTITGTVNIYNNNIGFVTPFYTSNSTSNACGIFLNTSSSCTSLNISGNYIHDLIHPGVTWCGACAANDVQGIYDGYTGGTKTFCRNHFENLEITNTGNVSGIVYGIDEGSSAISRIDSNRFDNFINAATAGTNESNTYYGGNIYFTNSGPATYTRDTIYNFSYTGTGSAANSTGFAYGFYLNATYNNCVVHDIASSTTENAAGFSGGGTTNNCKIYNISASGTLNAFGISGGTTITGDSIYNITSASGIAAGVYTTSGGITMSKTYIHDFSASNSSGSAYGAYLGGGTDNITNNMINADLSSTGNVYEGVYYTGAAGSIYNNSINMNSAQSVATNDALYIDGTSTVSDIRNNILSYSATSGVGQPFYAVSGTFNPIYFDYNIFYNAVAGTPNEATFGGNTFTSASAFPWGTFAATAQNTNSQIINPTYVNSASNLNITSQCVRGIFLASVTTDIHNTTRSNPPCIGADEISATGASTSLALVTPTASACGSTNVVFTLTNTSGITITSFNAGYSANGVLQQTQNFTGLSIAPGGTYTITFTGAQQYSYYNYGPVTLKGFISLPNGCVNAGSGDTVSFSFCQTLSGVYTINSSIPASCTNFTSFTSAAAALNCGITGNVTFNVEAGLVFTENPVKITYTNPLGYSIKFQKAIGTHGNADPQLLVTTGGTAVLEIDGGSNYSFDGINFTTSTTSTTSGFYLKGLTTSGCQNDTLRNCTVVGIAGTTTVLVWSQNNSTVNTASLANSNNAFFNDSLLQAKSGYVFQYSTFSTSNTYTTFAIDQNNQVGYNAVVLRSSPSSQHSTISTITSGSTNPYFGGIVYQNQTKFQAYNTTFNTTATASEYGIYNNLAVSTNSSKIYSNTFTNWKTSGLATEIIHCGYATATGGTVPVNDIYSNIIGVHSNPSTANISSTTTIGGIHISAGNGSIHDNQIYGLNTSGTVAVIGIDLTPTPAEGGTDTIYNNIIDSVFSTTNNATGINMPGSVAATRLVYRNTISNIYSKPTAALTSFVSGIVVSPTVTGTVNRIRNNTISNVFIGTTSNTGFNWVSGITISPSTNALVATDSIHDNTISHISDTASSVPNTAGVNVYGICISSNGGGATKNVIKNNTINYVKNTLNATGTAGLLNQAYLTAPTAGTGWTAGIYDVSNTANTIYGNSISRIISGLNATGDQAGYTTSGIHLIETAAATDTIANNNVSVVSSAPVTTSPGVYGIAVDPNVANCINKIYSNTVSNVYAYSVATASTVTGSPVVCGILLAPLASTLSTDTLHDNNISFISDTTTTTSTTSNPQVHGIYIDANAATATTTVATPASILTAKCVVYRNTIHYVRNNFIGITTGIASGISAYLISNAQVNTFWRNNVSTIISGEAANGFNLSGAVSSAFDTLRSNKINGVTGNGATSVLNGMLLAGGGATTVLALQDTVLNVNSTLTTNASQVAGINVATAGTNYRIDNDTIGNISSASTATSSVVAGMTITAGTTSDSIRNCRINNVSTATTTVSPSIYGLNLAEASTTSVVASNVISNVTANSASTGAPSVFGISVSAGTANRIYKNKFYSVYNTSTVAGFAYGLSVTGGTTNYIWDNMIYDIQANASTGAPGARGMSFTSGTDNVYYNSVYLNATSVSTAIVHKTAAAYISGGTVDLRNNILDNSYTENATGALTMAVALYKSALSNANLAATTNNNLVYAGTTPGVEHLLISEGTTTTKSTLPLYTATLATVDQAAVAGDPLFTATSTPFNLHLQNTGLLSPAINTAANVTSPIAITDDIDNQTRSLGAGYDIGADEINEVDPGPITISSGNNPSCTGQNVTFTIPAIANATSYTWVFPGVLGTDYTVVSGAGTNSITLNYINAVSGNVTVSGVLALASLGYTYTNSTTNSQVYSPVSATFAFSTLSTPAAPSTPTGTSPVCQGSAPTTYTTSSATATSYTWSITGAGASTISGTGTTGTVTWDPTFSGTATISVTGAASGCTSPSSASLNVTVTPTVGTPSTPSGSTTVCQASSATTYTTTATNATSYTWSITGGANSISGTGTTGTVTWDPTFSGTAVISVTANGCGTSPAATLNVTVTPTVGTPTTPSGTTSLCFGASPTAYTTSATNATSYTWSVTGTGNTISGTGTTGTVTWSPTFIGNATVSVTANNSCGSSVSSSSVTVLVGGLNGTYSINSTVVGAANLYPNTTTFNSFGTAIAALSCGITGQVIFNVAPGTYTGNISVPSYKGAGVGNDSVIFNGGSAASCFLDETSFGNNGYLVELNNCSYVTFENFTLETTLTAGFTFDGVIIEGPNSASPISHDDVINCTIKMLSESAAVSLGGGTFSGIVVNGFTLGDGNLPNISGYFSNIYLTGNTITNGHYGIVTFGSVATPSGVTITSNTITGFSTFGLDMLNVVCPKIRNNVINGCVASNLAEAVGMNTAANQSSSTDWVEISGNYITSLGRYGILLNGACGNSSQPTRIYNNMIYSSSTLTAARGISTLNSTFSPGNSYINYWNNSIVLNTASTATSGALTLDNGAANSDIRNNILAFVGSTTGLPIVIPTIANVTAFDYNIFYNSAATNEGSIGGTTYTSTTILNNNYGGSTTFNANSNVTNPNFVSLTDLDITLQCQRGTSATLTIVPTDIHGTTRANPPCIGADEIPSSTPTLTGVTQASAVCTGTSATINVSGLLYNAATGNTYTVNYTINGVAQTPTSVTASSGGTGSFTVTVTSANNGQVLAITSLTNTSTTCNNTFSSGNSVILSVNPVPGTPTTPSGTTSLCFGASPTAYTTSAANATSYSWSVSGTGNTISGTGTTGTVTWSSTFIGNATVSVTANNSCGSSVSSSSVTVLVGGLNGTYTIDNTVVGAANLYPNTATFNSFASAIAALSCGITGQVIFNVAPGTYTGNISVPSYKGAGVGNDSVIFNGGSAASCFLETTSYGNNGYLVELNSCSYVTFENFTLETTLSGFNFWGVSIEGPNSGSPISHDDVINCTINMASEAAAVTIPTGSSLDGIVVSGFTSGDGISQTISGYFSNIYLTSNTINNGHFGIIAGGNGATPSGVNIVGNTITGFSSIAIGLYNAINPKIRNNVINGGALTTANGANNARGISMNTAYNSGITTDWTEISGNNITFFGRYGILLNGVNGTSTQPTRIYNNMIYMYSTVVTAGIGISTLNNTFAPGNNYIDFWNNSVVLNDPSAQGALTIGTGATNEDIRNNIFEYIGTSTGYPISIGAISELTAFDYNIFYNSAATNEGIIGGTTYTSATILNNNYGGSTTFNTNSQVTNPNFVSTVSTSPDLDITAQCQRGTNATLTVVPTDIHRTTRANPPTIGADEIPSSTPTFGGVALAATVCSGSNATINLTGLTASSSFSVNYTINGVAQSPASVTSSSLGAGSFAVLVTAVNNGQSLVITGISNTTTGCSVTVSSGNVVTLSVTPGGTWLGISADWLTASNWCGGLPTAITDVVIPGATFVPNEPDLQFDAPPAPATGFCHNLTINNGATVTINGNGYLDIYGSITNNGTFTNNSSGGVDFKGTSLQTIPSLTFFNDSIDGTGGVSITGNTTINGTLTFVNGVITTGANDVIVASNSPAAILASAGNTNYIQSWVNGNLQRAVTTNTSSYDFPVGNATYSEFLKWVNNDIAGVNTLTAHFGAKLGTDAGLNVVISGVPLTTVNSNGVWYLDPNVEPIEGNYSLLTYFGSDPGWSSRPDEGFTIITRPDTSTHASSWTAPGTIPATGQPGRTYASGYAERDGFTSFSQYGIGEYTGTPLPITLVSFNAAKEDANALCTWQTATEQNTDHFDVEVSTNTSGSDFYTLGSVPAHGNSETLLNYNFLDTQPNKSGIRYYRLKSVDKDGSYSYSQVVALDFDGIQQRAISLYPNPASSAVYYSIYENDNSNIVVSIIDITGRVLLKNAFNSSRGVNTFSTNVSNLPQGMYILQFKDETGTINQKFEKF